VHAHLAHGRTDSAGRRAALSISRTAFGDRDARLSDRNEIKSMARNLTAKSRAGFRRGGLTAKAKKTGIFSARADNVEAGRLGAYASHERTMREQLGVHAVDYDHAAAGHLGGTECARRIVECEFCNTQMSQITYNRHHYHGQCRAR
jgi:hypothetical protein